MTILATPEEEATLFVPHMLLAEQTQASSPTCPEKRLMLAVLEQAIDDWRKYRGAVRYSPAWHMAKRAREWLWDDDMEWPYSFPRICVACGLEPDAVRLALA